VFASNCEVVNLLHKLLKELDWRNCANKRGRDRLQGAKKEVVEFDEAAENERKEEAARSKPVFEGKIYKLHGDMDHSERKTNYFQFDKNEACLLVCTDVASRGLDFKNVDWIVQWDLSSQVKEYVNRVGRTARIASNGQSICFVMSSELEYVQHLKSKY